MEKEKDKVCWQCFLLLLFVDYGSTMVEGETRRRPISATGGYSHEKIMQVMAKKVSKYKMVYFICMQINSLLVMLFV